MRSRTRHVLSLLTTAAFVTLAFGSLKPSPEEEKKRAEEKREIRATYDDWVKKVGAVYQKVKSAHAAGLADKACDGPAMLKTAKEEQYLTLPTVYGPYMARFASVNKGDWTEDKGPWAFLTESTFRGHFEKHADDRDAYALDGTGRHVKNDWMKNRFMIVFWPDDEKANRLPLLDDESRSFESGQFDGWLVVVDPLDGTLTCQKKLMVQNSEKVTSGQTFNKDPQKAIQKDFEDRFEAAVEAVLPPKVKSSNNMGSVLE